MSRLDLLTRPPARRLGLPILVLCLLFTGSAGSAVASGTELPEFNLLGNGGGTNITQMDMSTGAFSGTNGVFVVQGVETGNCSVATLTEGSYVATDTDCYSILADGNIGGPGSFTDTNGNSGSYTGELSSPEATVASNTAVSCTASAVGATSYSCEAAITGAGGTPTGNVTFAATAGSFPAANQCELANGSCSVNFTAPSSGSAPTVSAAYSADQTFKVSQGSTAASSSATPGAGSGTATALQITCDAFNPGDPTETFQCTAQVAASNGSTAILPTGTVAFTATDGGFPGLSTCALSPGEGASTCTIAFDPGDGNQLTITGTYSGDKTFAAATTQYPLQPDLGTSPTQTFEQQVCAAWYTGACTGILPAPDPIQTCVSLVQSCTGFGGAPAATPGTIDMAGFPSELTGEAGCAQTASNQSTAGSKTNTSGSPSCNVDAEVTADADPAPGLDPQKQYENNLAQFQKDVQKAQANFFEGLIYYNWALLDWTGTEALQAFHEQLDPLFTAEEEAGTDGPSPPGTADESNCKKFAGAALGYCHFLISDIFQEFSGALFVLGEEKEQLGVNVRFEAPPSAEAASAVATATRVKTRYPNHALVVAAGKATIKHGKHGKLVLRISAFVRAMLRHAAGEGIHTIKAKLHITAIHGTTITHRTINIRIRI